MRAGDCTCVCVSVHVSVFYALWTMTVIDNMSVSATQHACMHVYDACMGVHVCECGYVGQCGYAYTLVNTGTCGRMHMIDVHIHPNVFSARIAYQFGLV
jgi:hypothetical protein